MSNLTDDFIEGLYYLAKKNFGEDTILEAKKCLLDYIGVTLAGSKVIHEKSKNALLNLPDIGNTNVIGLNQKSSLTNAILFNGIHSHVIELDDGHRYAMMHPGAPIFSGLLPVAQKYNIEPKDILRGVVVGYEAAIRIACAVQPDLKLKGYHGTGIAGTIGTAVAISVALNFSKEQLKNAISAAATSAAGILKVIKNISELKPYNVGNAALSGYTSAFLGKSGFQGPHDVLDGDLGFLSMFTMNFKREYIDFSLNDSLFIHSIYRKPYAACRHCHSPIEAVLHLKKNHQINVSQIKSIEVKTYSLAVAGHEHTTIEGVNSAKMSIPYSVAVALYTDKAGLSEFTEEIITNNEILALTNKVKAIPSDELSKLVPEKRAAIVGIHTENNQIFEYRVDYPKGEPENPITYLELKEKFSSLIDFAEKTDSDKKHILQIVDQFEKRGRLLYDYV